MRLITEASPYIHSRFKTERIMLDVIIALIPALAVGSAVLGIRALLVTAVSVLSATVSEWLWCIFLKKKNTVCDFSAAVTGLLLAMTLPVTVSLWLVIVGNVFAIVFIKGIAGGLGRNIFNPALAARAFMLLIFPFEIVHYHGIDSISGATPLHRMVIPALPNESITDMIFGFCPGSIGEISAAAIILGGIYLVYRKVITLGISVAYIASLWVLSLIFNKTDNALLWSLYSIFSGGAFLGAVFMATDYTTSPVTAYGQIIYGIGCGSLTLLFRYYGLYPEGVTYAILTMNLFVWSIDRYTCRKRFGIVKEGALQ